MSTGLEDFDALQQETLANDVLVTPPSNSGIQNDDCITYIQIECTGSPNEQLMEAASHIFNLEASELNTEDSKQHGDSSGNEADGVLSLIDDYSEDKLNWPSHVPELNSADLSEIQIPLPSQKQENICSTSSTSCTVAELLSGAKPMLLIPRKAIPFPGTNGYPRYDDEALKYVSDGPVLYSRTCPGQPVQNLAPVTRASDFQEQPSRPNGFFFNFEASNPSQNFNNMYHPVIPEETSTSVDFGFMHQRRNSQTSHSRSCMPTAKKQRIIFSDAQCAKLKEAFHANPYLTKVEREKLARSLDLSQENVAVWFKNQRSKMKKRHPLNIFGPDSNFDHSLNI